LGLFPQRAEDLRERLAGSLAQKVDKVVVTLKDPGAGVAGLAVRPMSDGVSPGQQGADSPAQR
ncbi:MAG: hypothetical protein QOC94_39, partial [Actinoplanes sp.]|nr:hypothetical protein [Actinoplanes sp.]